MRALNKKVVTGAFSGLAIAAAAGSAAYACTAQPAIDLTDGLGTSRGANNTVRPNEVLTVNLSTMENGLPIEVFWNDPALAKQVSVAKGVGPAFKASFKIPGDARVTSDPFHLVAVQTDAAGKVVSRPMQQVFVDPSAPRTATGTTTPTGGGAATPQNGTPPAPQAGTAAPTSGGSTAPSASRASGARTAAPAAAAVAAPAAQAAVAAAEQQQQAVAGPAAPVPALPAESTALSGLPTPSDLWSGLAATTSPSLLDATAPAAPSRGIPAGGILLLGVGALAMAGAAIEASRRRVAVKVYRR